jgi:hypothetical protein
LTDNKIILIKPIIEKDKANPPTPRRVYFKKIQFKKTLKVTEVILTATGVILKE